MLPLPRLPSGSTGSLRFASFVLSALAPEPSSADRPTGACILSTSASNAVGHRRLSANGHRTAAVLACGPGALLGYRDAAALWGLRYTARTRIDVIVPRSVHP